MERRMSEIFHFFYGILFCTVDSRTSQRQLQKLRLTINWAYMPISYAPPIVTDHDFSYLDNESPQTSQCDNSIHWTERAWSLASDCFTVQSLRCPSMFSGDWSELKYVSYANRQYHHHLRQSQNQGPARKSLPRVSTPTPWPISKSDWWKAPVTPALQPRTLNLGC